MRSVQLAANGPIREPGHRVVVHVVGARVLTEVRSRRARVRRRRPVLLDVARACRRTTEERHDDRAGYSDRCLMNVARDERLVILVASSPFAIGCLVEVSPKQPFSNRMKVISARARA
jgi:hypothetical protein